MGSPAPFLDSTQAPNLYVPASAKWALPRGGPLITDASGRQIAPPHLGVPDRPVAASATAAAAAVNAVTLPGAANLTTYILGFLVSTANPAAAVTGVVTVTGLAGGVTLSFDIVEAVATGALLFVPFGEGLPASAPNTGIVVTLPAIASGAVSAVAVWGFQL